MNEYRVNKVMARTPESGTGMNKRNGEPIGSPKCRIPQVQKNGKQREWMEDMVVLNDYNEREVFKVQKYILNMLF